jgi:hypothetical protein
VVSDFNVPDMATEFGILRRVAQASGRPLVFSLTARHDRTEAFRELLALSDAASAEGLSIRPVFPPRPIGILFGLQGSQNPFSGTPSYRRIAALPPAERVARMRDPAMRAQILSEDPLAESTFPLMARLTYDRMFPFGNPPDYTPPREKSVAAIAARQGRAPAEVAYGILTDHDGSDFLFAPLTNYADFSLSASAECLRHPNAIVGWSDGGAHVAFISDASFGCTRLYGGPDIAILPAMNPAFAREIDVRTAPDPVIVAAAGPYRLLAAPQLPVRGVADLAAWLRANPGRGNSASSGSGATAHLIAELLRQRTEGLRVTHVPYRGDAPAVQVVAAGEAHYLFAVSGTAKPLVDAGVVRALATTGAQRLPTLPDVPTMIESGYPAFQVVAWLGFFAPPGTPAERTAWLYQAMAAALRAFVERDMPLRARVAATAGLRAEQHGRYAAALPRINRPGSAPVGSPSRYTISPETSVAR